MINEFLKESLDRYVNDKIETGGFLRACLENDLTNAIGNADMENREKLWVIVNYIYNEIPASCWGSKEKVAKWLGE